ncbi:L-threonine ammonia-lyase [Jatrophihabitans endophyticus]|uniref:L-threonine ammonia-lyase n=1 Tax=Jatrophihabitans endophyticus TaxID=1206085 RepID=A0A1M5CLW7_9ACTN|nr:threonine/serine dehydratase [Jatrophihabitans endophyticus]SHF55666.1 L-threonine ammonia-lyase [Jatrophihabitans endophyticus]
MITVHDVAAAEARIRPHVRRTPVLAVDEPELPGVAWLKLEFAQHTGSFKARGAFNRILAAQERGELDPAVGVVAASGGNAGLANAYAARQLGVPAHVFVPDSVPAGKLARLREYDAVVHVGGDQYADAYEAATIHVATTGAVLCHAYDQPEIVAGAGTLALELLADATPVDGVVIAVGGGGLAAGVATALDGRSRIVACEPETAATLHAAVAAGRPVDVAVGGVAADALGARRTGEIAFDVLHRAGRTAVTSVLVTDDDIVAARDWIWDRWRLLVEHSAATTVAALRTGAYRPEHGERLGVVLCGANTRRDA